MPMNPVRPQPETPERDARWWRRVRSYVYFGILVAGMIAVVVAGWLTLKGVRP